MTGVQGPLFDGEAREEALSAALAYFGLRRGIFVTVNETSFAVC